MPFTNKVSVILKDFKLEKQLKDINSDKNQLSHICSFCTFKVYLIQD